MGILQTSKRANSIVRGNRQYRIASFFLTNNNLKLDTWQMMRNIKSMRDRISLILKCEFFLALFGVMLAVYVDQSCWIGYVPTPEEEARGIPNPLANTTSLPECRSRRVGVELAKSAVTISTLLLILFIVYYNVMYVRLSEAKLFYFHTRRGSFDPYQFVLVKRKGIRQIQALRFLVELIICLPHCLPGFTMRIDIEMLGRVAVYRFESLIVIWMFFRAFDLNDNEAELVRIMSIEAMRCRLVIASARSLKLKTARGIVTLCLEEFKFSYESRARD
eukprot:764046-Hanusia_phi.AAC.7